MIKIEIEMNKNGQDSICMGRVSNGEQTNRFVFTIDEAEQAWQEIMNICHSYRRGDLIERVNN